MNGINRRRQSEQVEELQVSLLLAGLLAFSLLLCTKAAQFPIPRGIYVPSNSYTENVPQSGDIVRVGCVDSGGVPLRNATYSITGGNSELVIINSSSGQISWRGTQTPDYETNAFYLFDIMCQDNLDPSNTATARANVSVGPVNEFIPEINPSVITAFTRENAPQGTVLVSTQPGVPRQYTVTDNDDGPDGIITYTLTNTSDSLDGLFRVNPENGALSLARELDVDNIPTASDFLTVRITVCDTEPPRDECPNLSVTIIVQSAADNDPLFSENQYTVALLEDTSPGSVIATSMCSDQDSGIGAYGGIDIVSVVPNAEDLFQVVSAPADGKSGSGDLILQEPLDFETSRLYNVTLRCYDNQFRPVEDTARVIVIVRPVNDEPPVFEHIFYSFAVNRISTSGVDIGQVVANDNDQEFGGEISYSILTGDTDNFGVKPDGIVYLKDFIFIVEEKSFDLVIMASDGLFNTTTDVRIDVTGVLSIPEIGIIGSAAPLIIAACLLLSICCILRFNRHSNRSRNGVCKFDKSPPNLDGIELNMHNTIDTIINPGYDKIEGVLQKCNRERTKPDAKGAVGAATGVSLVPEESIELEDNEVEGGPLAKNELSENGDKIHLSSRVDEDLDCMGNSLHSQEKQRAP